MTRALSLLKPFLWAGGELHRGIIKSENLPDHGTAYEIAGKGEADPGSFKEAVFTGIMIFKNREEFEDLTKNPLKKQKVRAS